VTVDPDRLAALEEERKFLLASIRDLDRERQAGDVDEHDYVTLHDGYVARAAAVMRDIGDGRSSLTPKRHRPLWKMALVPVVTLLAAVGLGLAVRGYAGQRLPGQTLTGGQQMDEVSALLAAGRSKLGSDPAGAVAAYQKVLTLEPKNAEAHTYIAWLLVLNGQQASNQKDVQQGLVLLQRASEFDDSYADAHCLLAVGTGRMLVPPDKVTAKTEGAKCLANNPPADMRPMIQALLDSLK